jgi:hypothetical protein
MSKGQKLELSLAKRVEAMALGGLERKREFLTALVELIAACWAEAAPPPPPPMGRGRRGSTAAT